MNGLMRKSMLAVCLAGAVSLAGPGSVHAAAAKGPQLASLEQQIDYLGGALTEGIRTLDWKLVCMAVDGLKAASLAGKNLELVILRAERDAALEPFGMMVTGMGSGSAAQILALGMTARALAGDAQALATLRAWGTSEIPAVKPVDPAMYKDRPQDAPAAHKAYLAYTQALARRDFALLGLALIKEPGIADNALAALRIKGDPAQQMHMNGRSDTLVLAAVLADPAAGFKGLIALCADETMALSQQTVVVQSLTQAKANPKDAGAAFTLDAEFAALLPADTITQLAKPYVAMLKRWNPPAAGHYDYTVSFLISAGHNFPTGTFDADAIAAIESMKARLDTQNAAWMMPQIDSMLKRHGVDPKTAVAPPAQQGEF